MDIEIAGNRGSTGWLGFTFSRRSRIVIPGEVNGVAVQILLDSGAEQSIVDAGLARRLELRPTGSTTFSDRETVTPVQLMGGLGVAFGTLRLKGLTAVAADLAGIGAMTGLSLGLVLGREIFERTVVDLDFPNQRIAFVHPQNFSPPVGAAAAALRRFGAGHGRVVEILLEDRLPVSLEFDLGSANPIVLQHRFWSRAGLGSDRPLSNSLIGGVGGIRETGLVSLSSIRLAGVKLTDVDALLEPARGALEDRLGNGVVGAPILSRFRMVTDYAHDRLYLIDPSPTNHRLARNRSGLRVMHEQTGLKVLLVARHSPAANGDWAVGDTIVAINGLPVDDSYWAGDLSRWAEAPADTEVNLTVSDGSTRRLKLADYY